MISTPNSVLRREIMALLHARGVERTESQIDRSVRNWHRTNPKTTDLNSAYRAVIEELKKNPDVTYVAIFGEVK